MPRWAPRPVDLVAAAILTLATQLEPWLGPDPGSSRAVLAIAYGVETIAAAWHWIAPLTTITVCVTAMAVVPGALGVDPAASFGWLVTLLGVVVSAGYHSRRQRPPRRAAGAGRPRTHRNARADSDVRRHA